MLTEFNDLLTNPEQYFCVYWDGEIFSTPFLWFNSGNRGRSREAPMCRRIFALIGLFVALTTAAALAQEEPTYEGRGYGGPLVSDRTSSKGGSGARRSMARAGSTPPPPSATRHRSISIGRSASATTTT